MSDENKDDEVADDEDEVAGEDGGGGFGGKKLILFIVLPILLLGGGGAGVYFSGMLDSFLGEPAAEEAMKEEEKEDVADAPGFYMDLDEMLVTLSSKGRKQSFLKMRLSLELNAAEDESRVSAVMPRIIDNFQVFLRELRVEELQGSQGIYRVKEELLARVNAAAYPVKVKDVLFREILVQ